MNLKLNNISYDIGSLKPAISEKSFNINLEVYKTHLDNFQNASGDIPFDKAGAYLHKLYFEGLREYRATSTPLGKVAEVLELRYGSWDNFVKCYIDTVTKLQGSGWVFMNTSGYLNIIPNNRIVDNIAFVIDFFEHAYILDWGNDKRRYAMEQLKVINWEVVNQRIFDSKDKKQQKASII